MAQLPMTADEAQALVDAGHMTPETHAAALAANAFHPGDSVPPIDNGDIHPIDAIQNALSGGGSQEAFDQSMASLPKSPEEAQTLGQPATLAGPQGPISGVTVASNDPNTDTAIAAGLTPQAGTVAPSPTEAGHTPLSALALPAAPAAEAPKSDLEKLADPNAIAGGMKDEQAGLKASFDAGSKQASETAGYLHGMRQHMEAAQAQQQQMEQQRQDEAQKQYQKVQAAADEASKAAKIDPNHYWESRNTGQKIAAAIGLALGGIGGGLSGHGGNAAMDVINKAIDRDIESQKFNAGQKNQNFQNQQGIYNTMRQRFGDERQAEAATQMAYLQSAEMQIRETAAKYQSPEMQARALMLTGQLQQKQGEIARGIVAQGYQMAAMRQLTSGGAVGSSALSYLPEKVQERVVPLNGGTVHGLAYSPEAAKEVREVSSAADNVKSIISQMRQLKEEGGKRIIPYGTLYAKSQALQSRLIPALNEMAGLKRLSEEDIKNLKHQIPDAGSWLTSKTDALLDGLEQGVHDRTESYYKNNLEGYKPSKFTRTR